MQRQLAESAGAIRSAVIEAIVMGMIAPAGSGASSIAVTIDLPPMGSPTL